MGWYEELWLPSCCEGFDIERAPDSRTPEAEECQYGSRASGFLETVLPSGDKGLTDGTSSCDRAQDSRTPVAECLHIRAGMAAGLLGSGFLETVLPSGGKGLVEEVIYLSHWGFHMCSLNKIFLHFLCRCCFLSLRDFRNSGEYCFFCMCTGGLEVTIPLK